MAKDFELTMLYGAFDEGHKQVNISRLEKHIPPNCGFVYSFTQRNIPDHESPALVMQGVLDGNRSAIAVLGIIRDMIVAVAAECDLKISSFSLIIYGDFEDELRQQATTAKAMQPPKSQ